MEEKKIFKSLKKIFLGQSSHAKKCTKKKICILHTHTKSGPRKKALCVYNMQLKSVI